MLSNDEDEGDHCHVQLHAGHQPNENFKKRRQDSLQGKALG